MARPKELTVSVGDSYPVLRQVVEHFAACSDWGKDRWLESGDNGKPMRRQIPVCHRGMGSRRRWATAAMLVRRVPFS